MVSKLTVYEILVDVIEIMMVWILVLPFVIMAYFVLRKGYLPQEIINEILIIAAGLIIPLSILHTIFGGLHDWSQGHTDIGTVVVLSFIVTWMSFMFWTTLTPSALMLIGIRLGLVKDEENATVAKKSWDYFLAWNKLLRIYLELNKWGAILFFLGFTVGLPIYANYVDSQPTAYVLFCFPLFFVILYFTQDRSKVEPSTTFSTPTNLPMMFELEQRMHETGFMEKVEAGGGKVLGEAKSQEIIHNLQEKMTEEYISHDSKAQDLVYFYEKNHLAAIILALIWPGLDRCYLGDVSKGILFSISAVLLLPTIIGTLLLWIINLVTAAKRTEAYNLNSIREYPN